MSDPVGAAPQPKRMNVRVKLEIAMTAFVTVNTDSSESIDEIRDKGMKKFDEVVGAPYRVAARDRVDVNVLNSPTVKVCELSVVPQNREAW